MILGLHNGAASAVGTSDMGEFGGLAIFMGLLNDLFLLPVVLLTFKPRLKGENLG